MTSTRQYQIGYVSPESGYTMMLPQIYTVETVEQLEETLGVAKRMTDERGTRLGITYRVYSR